MAEFNILVDGSSKSCVKFRCKISNDGVRRSHQAISTSERLNTIHETGTTTGEYLVGLMGP